jgi:hypothetical protein
MEMYLLLRSQRGSLMVWDPHPGDCVVTLFPEMTTPQSAPGKGKGAEQ